MEEAAICACTIGTALHVVRTRGHVAPEESVLITGASGGVGLHAIQVCKMLGASVVAVTSSPRKEDRLREAGADEGVGGPNLAFSRAGRPRARGRGVRLALGR